MVTPICSHGGHKANRNHAKKAPQQNRKTIQIDLSCLWKEGKISTPPMAPVSNANKNEPMKQIQKTVDSEKSAQLLNAGTMLPVRKNRSGNTLGIPLIHLSFQGLCQEDVDHLDYEHVRA